MLAAPRTSLHRVAARRQLPNPRTGHELCAARGALERRCQARRLTRAWSWRRPAVRVEFHLCRTKLGAAAQARSVRRPLISINRSRMALRASTLVLPLVTALATAAAAQSQMVLDSNALGPIRACDALTSINRAFPQARDTVIESEGVRWPAK